MVGDIVTGIIAGGSAIGGGLIVAVSNYVTNRAQGRDAHTAELRRVLSSLLHALELIDHQLRTEPPPRKIVRTINTQMQRFPQLDYTVGRARRRLFEPHLDALVDRMFQAMTATTLIAPTELLPSVEAVALVMTDFEVGDPAWFERWDRARADLVVACRRAVGEVAPDGR